jgi:hypothetical protein
MDTEPPIAFAIRETHPPGLEIRVNFGILAGRGATQAEIDTLGRDMLALVPDVTIVAEQHHAIGRGHEAVVHLVKVEPDVDETPDEDLAERLVDVASAWAEACAADRHTTV